MEIIDFSDEKHIENMITDPNNSEKIFVIDCGATWCGPCRTFGKFYHEFAENYSKTDRVAFCKLDVDNVTEFCKVNRITSVPTILFIKNAGVIEKIVGADTNKFKNTLIKCLSKNKSSGIDI